MRSFLFVAASLLLACLTAACSDEGRTRGPSTRVTAIHAAPTHSTIAFLREERVNGTLDYRAAASFDFEVGQYDFHVETRSPGDSAPQRDLSFSETLLANTDYYFVITESGSALYPLVVAKPFFAPAAMSAEVSVVHAAPAVAPVSVYLTTPGADLSAANPIGSVAFTQNLAPQTFPPGDYQLSLTENGNPLNVLFSSPTFPLVAGVANMLAITDGTAQTTAQAVVVWNAGGSVTTLQDLNAPSLLRVINAPSDAQPRDIVVDDNFAAPLFPAAPYAQPTDFGLIAPGDRKINVTPAGNPGVIEGENRPTIFGGAYYTTVVAGATGDLEVATAIEDQRRVRDEAHVRIYNGAGQFAQLDFFVLPPGTSLVGVIPLRLLPATAQSWPPLAPGNFELTVRVVGTETIAYGPAPLSLAAGGAYGVAAFNGATPETAGVVLFDDF